MKEGGESSKLLCPGVTRGVSKNGRKMVAIVLGGGCAESKTMNGKPASNAKSTGAGNGKRGHGTKAIGTASNISTRQACIITWASSDSTPTLLLEWSSLGVACISLVPPGSSLHCSRTCRYLISPDGPLAVPNARWEGCACVQREERLSQLTETLSPTRSSRVAYKYRLAETVPSPYYFHCARV